MLFEELLGKIRKIYWVRVIEQRNGFISGYILGENKKKKTDFTLFYEGTYLRLSFGNNKKGLRFVNFIEEEMNVPYLKVTCCNFIDIFSFFKNKLIIYMWEIDDAKFAILHKDYERIIGENKKNWFGYKNIHLLVPPAHKRRSK